LKGARKKERKLGERRKREPGPRAGSGWKRKSKAPSRSLGTHDEWKKEKGHRGKEYAAEKGRKAGLQRAPRPQGLNINAYGDRPASRGCACSQGKDLYELTDRPGLSNASDQEPWVHGERIPRGRGRWWEKKKRR